VPLTLDESYFRAAAWLGSDQFDAALIQTPCGCELAEKAQREPDANARKVLSREATDAQQGWCCPHAGHALRPLDFARVQTLDAVERMTGWRGAQTCPRAALSAPGVTDALRLLPAVEHGTLVTLQGLPAVLHEAAYACAAGRSERYEYEQRVREQQRKAGNGGG
jgi:hypothetical protein